MTYVAYFRKSLLNHVFLNSFWGIFSNIFQNFVFALFFIVLARSYSGDVLSNYILANTLYGLVLSFSTLGLGQAFIRGVVKKDNLDNEVHSFLSIQLLSGILFYLFQILLSYSLYRKSEIVLLSTFLGINIIFDNIIYVFKTVNIIHQNQRKTFLITSSEALFKLVFAFTIWIFVPDIIYVILLLVFFRFFTLIYFLIYGIPESIKFHFPSILDGLKFRKLISTILTNRYFIIIGSLSVLYWSYGNIFVSKMLGIEFVPEFEISYKLFSMAELIPLVFSATLFPVLTKKLKDRREDLLNYYRLLFRLYLFYGFISFLFIYVFASDLLPFLFGRQYQSTAMYCKELFFTMLLFPTSLLQANLIIATGYERLDMKFNFVLLFMLVLTSLYFLQIYHSLSALNVSIFISFLLFHILQDIHLFRKRYMKLSDILFFYLYLLIVVYFFYAF